MRIDFCSTLYDFNGDPVKHMKADQTMHDATLKSVCVEVLMVRFPGEDIPGSTQLERYTLAKKIHKSNGEGLELTSDQVTELKRLLAKGYSPQIVGAACEILDPAAIGE